MILYFCRVDLSLPTLKLYLVTPEETCKAFCALPSRKSPSSLNQLTLVLLRVIPHLWISMYGMGKGNLDTAGRQFLAEIDKEIHLLK